MKYMARSSLQSNTVHWKRELQGLKRSQVSSIKCSKSFKTGNLKGRLELLGKNDLSLRGPQTQPADLGKEVLSHPVTVKMKMKVKSERTQGAEFLFFTQFIQDLGQQATDLFIINESHSRGVQSNFFPK